MRAYRKSRGELDTLATQVVKGEIHIAVEGPALEHSFGHLLMMLPAHSRSQAESIGAVYEHMSKALPTAINGYPFFASCQFVHVKDMKRLHKLVERKQRALEGRSLTNRLFDRRLTAGGSS